MAPALVLVLAAIVTLFGTFIVALAYAQWATRGMATNFVQAPAS